MAIDIEKMMFAIHGKMKPVGKNIQGDKFLALFGDLGSGKITSIFRTTIIKVRHDLPEVFRHAHKVLKIKSGQISVYGMIEELFGSNIFGCIIVADGFTCQRK